MTLSRLSLQLVRQNAEDFVKQEHGDTCKLMPVLPKRIIAICDTALALMDKEDRRAQTELRD